MSELKNDNRSREVEQNLINISRLEDGPLFEKYKTDPEGLNQVEAADRLKDGLKFALTEALLLEIHRLELNAALLEESLGFLGIVTFFCSKYLYIHFFSSLITS